MGIIRCMATLRRINNSKPNVRSKMDKEIHDQTLGNENGCIYLMMVRKSFNQNVVKKSEACGK